MLAKAEEVESLCEWLRASYRAGRRPSALALGQSQATDPPIDAVSTPHPCQLAAVSAGPGGLSMAEHRWSRTRNCVTSFSRLHGER